MSYMILIIVGVPFGVGLAGFLGLILEPRQYPRRRSTNVDRAQRSFHGRNQ